MKNILSNQLDSISGGWADVDGSGHHSATNGGSRSGQSNTGGNSGNHSLQSFLSQNFPYGSGSGASGFWGGTSTGNGYGSNTHGYNADARHAGDNH
ncbi:hypothetical protein ACR6A7_12940 [Pantoea sp. RRHST58]|uniref:hypothetical protein n=1 Tax=Pantoea sp. RRHST58 TaxID=3425183 RepID=UPI003DA04B33